MLSLGATALIGTSAATAVPADHGPRPGSGTAAPSATATAVPGLPAAPQLAAMVQAVSDPTSPKFHHFLDPSRVAALLPDLADLDAAVSVRSAHGAPARPTLMHTQWVSAQTLEQLAANESAKQKVTGPRPSTGRSAGAGSGSGPSSTASAKPSPTSTSSSGSSSTAQCSQYYGQTTSTDYPLAFDSRAPFAVCGYSPAQLRAAYGADDETGSGATVAILDAYGSPTMPGDADTYATDHGDPGFGPGQYTQHVDPSTWTLQNECGGTAVWAQEQALDIEAVHATAPDAKVLYYGADSCQDTDLLAGLEEIVQNHLADIVTSSWGGPMDTAGGDEPADVVADYDRVFQVAALEGITVDFSSGDCGADSPDTACGGSQGLQSAEPQPTFPAADPWVTAVGGTSVAIGRGGRPLWQTPWGTRAWSETAPDSGATTPPGPGWQDFGWVFGGGGGTSVHFAEPWYQDARVPSALSSTLPTGDAAPTPRRTVPDLSLDADPFTGMAVGLTALNANGVDAYTQSAIGGTSLSSPLLAGLEADVMQTAGQALGFLNPVLYELTGSAGITDVLAAPTGAGQTEAEIFPTAASTTASASSTGSASSSGSAKGATAKAGQTGKAGSGTSAKQSTKPGRGSGSASASASASSSGSGPSASSGGAMLVGFGDDAPLTAQTGYDIATGLGTPGAGFIPAVGAEIAASAH